MRVKVVVIFIGWLLCGAAQAASSILVFGDSLSAGYGLAAHQAWPDLLQQRLTQHASTRSWHVVNASVSGETSAGGLTRLPDALAQFHPAIVILELGANDGLRGLSLDVLQQNLDAMIRQSRHSGAQVLLVGIRLPVNYGRIYNEKLQQVYAATAQRAHVVLLPSLLGGIEMKPELFQADGLHPVAAAENQVMETVWKDLLPMLRTKTP